jgi:hypothetical protein
MSKDGHVRTALFLTHAQKRIGGKQTGNEDAPRKGEKGGDGNIAFPMRFMMTMFRSGGSEIPTRANPHTDPISVPRCHRAETRCH